MLIGNLVYLWGVEVEPHQAVVLDFTKKRVGYVTVAQAANAPKPKSMRVSSAPSVPPQHS